MSSPCRYAAAIIVRPIAPVTKPRGGQMLALIRLSLPVRFGWRRIRCRQVPTKWAAKARPRLTAVGADQQNAKRDRPITKSGPDDETKPIIATGPQ